MGRSEDIDIGEASRVDVLRRAGAGLEGGFDLDVDASTMSSSSSSSLSRMPVELSESVEEISFFHIPSSSLSFNSYRCAGLLLAAVVVFFAAVDFTELSDSVVGIRGTFEGRRGLNAGTLRFEDG